jgi:hypothetical protein
MALKRLGFSAAQVRCTMPPSNTGMRGYRRTAGALTPIRSRTGEGRARAKARGVRMGRKPKVVLPVLRSELLRRGYSLVDIAKILGGNWMRVFGQAWNA